MRKIVFLLVFAIGFVTIAEDIPKYSRKDYMSSWGDEDGDCINTRHEVLIRDSLVPVTMDEDNPCLVRWGLWVGRLSGEWIVDARKADIDHLVALSEAHRAGAWMWDRETKRAFANNMDNLFVTFGPVNKEKSDHDMGDWLPPWEDARPWFVNMKYRIKSEHGLLFRAAEIDNWVRYKDDYPGHIKAVEFEGGLCASY